MINFILICVPNHDYNEWQAFSEIALSISASLKALGHPAEVTIDPSICTGRTLVFGAHLLSRFGGTIEGGDYIIFNLEQVPPVESETYAMNPWFSDGKYIEILKRYPVWDYSLSNITELAKHSVYAKHCEIGYHPNMNNLRVGKSTTLTGGGTAPVRLDYVSWATTGLPVGVFDVLFYGSMNERRQKIIDDLRKVNLNVVIANGYGQYRDKYINRAKVVLNCNFYDTAIFNIVRVAPLLANAKAVVSEESNEAEAYRDAVAFSPYDGIVDKCREVVSGDYETLGNSGFDIFKQHDQIEILKRIL